MLRSLIGARVAVCELPYGYKSSASVGGVGGTCVLRGCVPKKMMVYGSEYAEEFADSSGFGYGAAQLDCTGFVWSPNI